VRVLAPLNGLYLRYLDKLHTDPANMTDAAFNAFMDRARAQAPGVAIVLGNSSYDPSGLSSTRHRWRAEMTISLYVYSTHRRDLVDGRLDADVVSDSAVQADPGVWAMLEHLDDMLLGAVLDFEWAGSMVPQGHEEVISDTAITMWRARYSVRIERLRDPHAGITEALRAIETQHSGALSLATELEL
jgi:hypothetical protein